MIPPSNIPPQTCPTCGTTFQTDAVAGLCPKCLLLAASETGKSSTPSTLPEPMTVEDLQNHFPELEIFELIGHGGMGAVYRARQPRLKREIALKILSCPETRHEEFSLRFEREAQALARLSDPHIVTIHDVGDRDDIFYLIMEYVEGVNLGQLIANGDLNPSETLPLASQICDALQSAHEQGVTHRDLKPTNILINKSGLAKIADFGLAKMTDGDGDASVSGLTLTGTPMGTPHYMAPEQWHSPDEVDHRADIYALGAILYEMLTGERPAANLAPPSDTDGVDSRFNRIVTRAMATKPDKRYQQATEIKTDLNGITRPCESNGYSRYRLPLISLLAILLLGLVVFFAGKSLSRNEEEANHRHGLHQREQPSVPASQSKNQKPSRLLIFPTHPDARQLNPGAPWDLLRNDVVDLQVAETNNANHGITVALTSDGTLLDWIDKLPELTILPLEVQRERIKQFSIHYESGLAGAILLSGEIIIWKWQIDPESRSVRIFEVEQVDFDRTTLPIKLKAVGHGGILALYENGNIETYPRDFPYLNQDTAKRNSQRIMHISPSLMALYEDGSLVDLFHSERPGIPLLPLPLKKVRLLRYGTYLPTAILHDGSVWYWNQNDSDVEARSFLPTLYKAQEEAPVTDIRTHQCGDVYFAIQNQTGNWYVSHDKLSAKIRNQLKGASIVYRTPDYVLGLMPD